MSNAGVFPGGCFFVATSGELGARPGPVHDRVAQYQQQWRDLLEHEALAAQERGELHAGEEPEQLAFDLGAILTGANIITVLHSDPGVIDRARRTVRTRLAPVKASG